MEGLAALIAMKRTDVFVVTLNVDLQVPLLCVKSAATFNRALEHVPFLEVYLLVFPEIRTNAEHFIARCALHLSFRTGRSVSTTFRPD